MIISPVITYCEFCGCVIVAQLSAVHDDVCSGRSA